MRTLGMSLCAASLICLATEAAEADTTALRVAESRPVPPDASIDERRSVARTLAIEGYDLLQAGSYSEAIRLFTEAEKLYHAPTIVLLLAEAHEKLGKLVEARSFYEAITVEELPRTAPLEFFEAQRTAQRNLELLEKRLPTLQVLVPGASREKVRVTVDGERISPFDQARAQNPGRHMVAVTYDNGRTVSQEVVLREGATERFHVPVAAVEGGSSSVLVPAAIAFGTGAAGLGVGVVAGIVATNKAGELSERCSAGPCTDEGLSSSVSRWTTVTLIGLAAAGVGLGTGAVILYLDRPSSTARGTAVQATVGLGSVGVRGTF